MLQALPRQDLSALAPDLPPLLDSYKAIDTTKYPQLITVTITQPFQRREGNLIVPNRCGTEYMLSNS